jgi:hypothetical protein
LEQTGSKSPPYEADNPRTVLKRHAANLVKSCFSASFPARIAADAVS